MKANNMIKKLLKEREEDFEKFIGPAIDKGFDDGEFTQKSYRDRLAWLQDIKSHNTQTNKLLIEKVIEMCGGEKVDYSYPKPDGEKHYNQALDQIITQLRKEI